MQCYLPPIQQVWMTMKKTKKLKTYSIKDNEIFLEHKSLMEAVSKHVADFTSIDRYQESQFNPEISLSRRFDTLVTKITYNDSGLSSTIIY